MCLAIGTIFALVLFIVGTNFMTMYGTSDGIGLIIGGVVVIVITLWFSIDIFKNRLRQVATSTPIQSTSPELNTDGIASEPHELMQIGSQLMFLKKFEDAKEVYKQIIAKEEHNAFAWKGLGEASAFLDEYETAIDAFERYLHYRPDELPEDVMDYLILGPLFSKINKPNRAIMCFQKALRIDPLSKEAHYGLLIETKYKPQVLVFESAIEIEKSFKEPYLNLGKLHREFGFFEEALELYNKAFTEFGREDSDILNGFAGLLYDQNKFTEALDVFQKIIELYPDHWEALGQMGQCYGYLKDTKKAIEYTQQALAINQNAPDLLNNLGLFYYHEDQIENALRTLKQVLIIDPTHEYAKKNIHLIKNDTEAIKRAGILLEDLEKEY